MHKWTLDENCPDHGGRDNPREALRLSMKARKTDLSLVEAALADPDIDNDQVWADVESGAGTVSLAICEGVSC